MMELNRRRVVLEYDKSGIISRVSDTIEYGPDGYKSAQNLAQPSRLQTFTPSLIKTFDSGASTTAFFEPHPYITKNEPEWHGLWARKPSVSVRKQTQIQYSAPARTLPTASDRHFNEPSTFIYEQHGPFSSKPQSPGLRRHVITKVHQPYHSEPRNIAPPRISRNIASSFVNHQSPQRFEKPTGTRLKSVQPKTPKDASIRVNLRNSSKKKSLIRKASIASSAIPVPPPLKNLPTTRKPSSLRQDNKITYRQNQEKQQAERKTILIKPPDVNRSNASSRKSSIARPVKPAIRKSSISTGISSIRDFLNQQLHQERRDTMSSGIYTQPISSQYIPRPKREFKSSKSPKPSSVINDETGYSTLYLSTRNLKQPSKPEAIYNRLADNRSQLVTNPGYTAPASLGKPNVVAVHQELLSKVPRIE